MEQRTPVGINHVTVVPENVERDRTRKGREDEEK
jgi:hypothetical protein